MNVLPQLRLQSTKDFLLFSITETSANSKILPILNWQTRISFLQSDIGVFLSTSFRGHDPALTKLYWVLQICEYFLKYQLLYHLTNVSRELKFMKFNDNDFYLVRQTLLKFSLFIRRWTLDYSVLLLISALGIRCWSQRIRKLLRRKWSSAFISLHISSTSKNLAYSDTNTNDRDKE